MRLQRSISYIILITALSLLILAKVPQNNFIQTNSFQELQSFLSWSKSHKPLISAHRGGPMLGFPENAIETFENAISYSPSIIECDVRKSKDGVLVMMHDETIDRTTTGYGKVGDHTWESLKKLSLKDETGTTTQYRIPTLAECLKWAKGKAILSLDVKDDVTPEEIVETVKSANAEGYITVITYNLESALKYYQLHPQMMISATVGGTEGVKRLLESGIPTENMIVFVGVYEPEQIVYQQLHEKKICTILGTIGNLDRKADKKGADFYATLLENGADVLATDNVALAAKGIQQHLNNTEIVNN